MEFKEKIAIARELALNHVVNFLEVEAEHSDIRDIKVATDIIKNLENEDATIKTLGNMNVLVQTLATKFNLPQDNMKALYSE